MDEEKNMEKLGAEEQGADTEKTRVAEPPAGETRVSPATSGGFADGEKRLDAPARARAAAVVAACAVVLLAVLGGVGYAAGWFGGAADDAPVAEQQSDEALAEADGEPEAADEAEPTEDAEAEPEDSADGAEAANEGPDQGDSKSESTSGSDSGSTPSAAPTPDSPGSGSSGASGSGSSGSGSSSNSSSNSGSGSTSGSASTSAAPAPAPKPATVTVTVSIDSSRARAYDAGWPASMGSATLTLSEGSTVYDALRAMGVSVGGSSYYVSSINGLAEKACGATSGWTYSVNGVFPNKACGRYVLTGGESVRWVYSTDADPTISY